MPSHEELVARERAVRDVLERGVEERLRAIPGVIHVSIGLKEQGGRVTQRHSIRVYVERKVDEDQLTAEQRVPREIDGVPTDVNVAKRFEFARDSTRYRPVKGGIMITNRIIALKAAGTGTKMQIGTFGCTATRTSDSSVVLLSNWHVLTCNGADNGDPIFQPGPTSLPTLDVSQLPLLPSDDTDKIARIVDAQITSKVDAGIARIDVSSCCRCCGIDYRDEINGLSIAGHPPSNNILGVRAAVSGATVYKVGIATGRTVGQVVDTNTGALSGTLNGVNYTLNGQIE